MIASDSTVLTPSFVLTGVTVMRTGAEYALCPFFGKCDGLLIVEPKAFGVTFMPNTNRDPESLRNMIIAAKVTNLICGFIPDAECEKLRSAGVDVRCGSGACSLDELVVNFANLPDA